MKGIWNFWSRLYFPFKAPSLEFPIFVSFFKYNCPMSMKTHQIQKHVLTAAPQTTLTCIQQAELAHSIIFSYLSLSDEWMKERKTLQENHIVTKYSNEQTQGSVGKCFNWIRTKYAEAAYIQCNLKHLCCHESGNSVCERYVFICQALLAFWPTCRIM